MLIIFFMQEYFFMGIFNTSKFWNAFEVLQFRFHVPSKVVLQYLSNFFIPFPSSTKHSSYSYYMLPLNLTSRVPQKNGMTLKGNNSKNILLSLFQNIYGIKLSQFTMKKGKGIVIFETLCNSPITFASPIYFLRRGYKT